METFSGSMVYRMLLEVDENGCIEVVFNYRHGGFGLSEVVIKRMIELGSEEAKRYYDTVNTYPYKVHSHLPKVSRFDPILIQVIKELDDKAAGAGANLAICKVRLDDIISIDCYDGIEEVKLGHDNVYYGKQSK